MDTSKNQSNKQTPASAASELERFTQIVRKQLGIRTLEIRRMDSLDFHSVSVWQVEKALRAACEAGRESMRRRRSKPKKQPKTSD